MKTTININGKDVEITLTPEQVEKINKSSMTILDRIKTFKDACEYLNIVTHKDSYELLNLKRTNNAHLQLSDCDDSYLKLMIVTLALNEGMKVNLATTIGYFPYFNFANKQGSGFFTSGYLSWAAGCTVSSRLAFRTSALAEYSGKQFEDLYYDYAN